jgi:transcriptional regulator GlxA family with amidase domain
MQRSTSAPLEVCFVLPRGSLLLDWAGPAEAFRFANTETVAMGLGPAFHLRFAAPVAESASSVGALIAGLEPLPEVLAAPAWVVLVGRTTLGTVARPDREARAQADAVVRWLRRLRPGQGGLRLVTVCVGALLAAEAGLLDGRRATTHHMDLDELRAAAPSTIVVPDRVFVTDGDLWSSAGVTAGIDIALHLVSDHCGPVVAARVAQRMAVALRRGPDDPQLSPFLAHRQHLNARLHRVQDAVARAPQDDWSADRLAAVASTTPRTLNRLFSQHAGVTPLAYVRGIRVALARQALAAGSSVARAAEAAGFRSDLQLRRAWQAVAAPDAPAVPSGRQRSQAGATP